jgi:hypothetical protein
MSQTQSAMATANAAIARNDTLHDGESSVEANAGDVDALEISLGVGV